MPSSSCIAAAETDWSVREALDLASRTSLETTSPFSFETLRIASPSSLRFGDRSSAPNSIRRSMSFDCPSTSRLASQAPTDGLRSFFSEAASSELPVCRASDAFASRAAVN